jgi:hypothetical protein
MRRIAPRRDGTFSIRLRDEERAVLAALPGQLIELLEHGDASLARLFPPAYADDLDRDREFHRLMHEDLLASKRESAEILAATAGATVLDERQIVRWMGAINDLRLVIGTQLDLHDDGDDMEEVAFDEEHPDHQRWVVYRFLTHLLALVVEALSARLPDQSQE